MLDFAQNIDRDIPGMKMAFALLGSCKFQFRTLSEAECLSVFLSNAFPDPKRASAGLVEILVNAIEHGNLGVGYQLKTELIASHRWREEIEKRQALPEHREKFVEVVFARKPEGAYAMVKDQGGGFNWQKYLNADPMRSGNNHGRGIAKAASQGFDKLTYNSIGNQAVCFMSKQQGLEW